jgi:hypothetical protein
MQSSLNKKIDHVYVNEAGAWRGNAVGVYVWLSHEKEAGYLQESRNKGGHQKR